MANSKYSFTREEIECAAHQAKSRTEMMRLLKIKQSGGGYQALDYWCKKHGVAPPVYTGGSAGRKINPAMPDCEWFVDGVRRSGPATKKRLVAMGIPDECSMDNCGQGPVWNGKPLTLQIDHINGNRWDNRLENIRILCPHCHTQTETYANTGRRKARFYCDCGSEIWKGSARCVKCANALSNEPVINWPSVDEVVKQVQLTNFSQAATLYKCSDNAIRKFLKRNGIDPKSIK